MKKKHDWYVGTWDLTIKGPDGVVKEEFLNLRNGLSDDGEAVILSNFFRNTVHTIGNFNVRLCSQALTEGLHYSDAGAAGITWGEVPVAAVDGGNYPMAVVRNDSVTGWETLAVDVGDWRTSSAQFTLLAASPGSGIGPFSTLFLTAPVRWNTGKIPSSVAPNNYDPAGSDSTTVETLIAYLAVPTRTIVAGDTLLVTARVKLQ